MILTTKVNENETEMEELKAEIKRLKLAFEIRKYKIKKRKKKRIAQTDEKLKSGTESDICLHMNCLFCNYMYT